MPNNSIGTYIDKAMPKYGLGTQHRARVMTNLAVAGIYNETNNSTISSEVVDSLLSKLSKKLGDATKQVEHSGRRAEAAPKKRTQAEQVSAVSYTKSLRAGVDPATGEKLNKVKLLTGIYAFHNPSTRVVYPIPGSDNLPQYV